MNCLNDDSARRRIRWAIWLLIAASTATMVGRIMLVRAPTGESPMLSANDRSRWCTVRALVDHGTYAIDALVRQRDPVTNRRVWSTIDMVRHRGPDGKEHYYSSKPTLFPTLLAGQYWVIRHTTGLTLGEHPFLVIRLMLVITNVLPLLLFFVVLWRLVDQLANTDAARLFTLTAACWGTFLTTFAVTINNHEVAAVSVLLATALTLRIWHGECRAWYYFGAGLFGAFAVANELPALSFFAVVSLAVAWKSPRKTLTAFAPAALLVATAFFGTNYIAHGTWSPPYVHRSDGPVVARAPESLTTALDQQELTPALRSTMQRAGITLSDQALILVEKKGQRWAIWDRVGHKRFAIVPDGDQLAVRRWDNWYDYRGSYWREKRQGVDRGEPSRAVYALHVLVGHHGVFSLTPLWILSGVGVVMLVRGRRPGWQAFGWMVAGLTFVCLAFYIARPMADRNYGGMCSGFRWMFWFTPLWLLCLVPAADVLLAGGGMIDAGPLLRSSPFPGADALRQRFGARWLPGCHAEVLLLAARPDLGPTSGPVLLDRAREVWDAVEALGWEAPPLHLGAWEVPAEVVRGVADAAK